MRLSDKLAIILILVFIIGSSLVSLHRYWQYEADYYDFGIFDTVLWKASRFQPLIVDHFVVQGKWIFADHFYPSLLLLAPLYWFTGKQEIMLIAQAITVGVAGLFLYLTALKQVKNSIAAHAILISFFGFVGLQNALWFDIHEVTFLVLPLSIIFYAIATNRRSLFWISYVLALGFKESVFVTLIGLSIYVFLSKKEWRKIAFASILVAGVYGLVVIKLVIPYFLGGPYFYSEVFSYDWINPATYINIYIDNPIKIQTLFNSFLSFGFLPAFAAPLWPAYLFHFLTRFTSSPIRWDLGLHYSAELAPFLSLGCIYVLKKVATWPPKTVVTIASVGLMAMSFYAFRFKFHGPLLLAINLDFYRQTAKVNYPGHILSKIPGEASVMAQQNLATHVNHRDQLWVLRDNYEAYQPEYIVVDNRHGLSPAHFWGVSDIDGLVSKIEADPGYTLVDKFHTVKLFKKSP
jgi:uncharacterized membrane protein